MDHLAIGLIGLAFMLALVLIGIPIPVSAAAVSILGIAVLGSVNAAILSGAILSFSSLVSYSLSVIPLFVMMGVVLFVCGIGEEIFKGALAWFGHIRGGLAAATTAACAAIGTTTGSAAATTALMARVAYPEMKNAGYQPRLALGVIAASGTIASMIPPSILIVIFAVLAELNVGKMLVAGFIPGIISAAIYIAMIVLRAKFDPKIAPTTPPASWHQRFSSLPYLLPVVIMFGTVVGGIYGGIFTPTEAGGVAALVSFTIVIAMRRLSFAKFKKIIIETAGVTLLVLIFIMSISLFTKFLTYSGVTIAFARMALSFENPMLTLLLMMGVCFIFGMFISATGMIMIVTPIFVPVIINIGYDPIWFGILIIKMCEVAAITPPVCVGVYIAQGIIKEVPSEQAIRGILPFLACDILTLGLLIAVPQITTFLPSTM